MKRSCLLSLGCSLAATAAVWDGSAIAEPPNTANQQSLLSQSGEIRGAFAFCGPRGNDGTLIHVPGTQFQVKTDASGVFVMHYVPQGEYSLRFEVPDRPPFSRPVEVFKNIATELGTIVHCPDNDGDGFMVDTDCNDNNPSVYPGATEVCDGLDNNCDGETDEGCSSCTDADADGFPAQSGCPKPPDCDDTDPTAFPGATEVCNGRDDDCDGVVDQGFDADVDGFTSCQGDCEDDDPDINPVAAEQCDGKDNDCDGVVDDGLNCDPLCRNGELDPGEECDDGNPYDGDGCQSDCTLQPLCHPDDPESVCGEASHCLPTPSGTPFCAPGAGSGTQGSSCLSIADCAAGFDCLSLETQDPQCLAWCRVADNKCDCHAMFPPLLVGAEEWGVCF